MEESALYFAPQDLTPDRSKHNKGYISSQPPNPSLPNDHENLAEIKKMMVLCQFSVVITINFIPVPLIFSRHRADYNKVVQTPTFSKERIMHDMMCQDYLSGLGRLS